MSVGVSVDGLPMGMYTASIEMNIKASEATPLVAGSDIFCALSDDVERFSSEPKDNYFRLGSLESVSLEAGTGIAKLSISGVAVNPDDWKAVHP